MTAFHPALLISALLLVVVLVIVPALGGADSGANPPGNAPPQVLDPATHENLTIFLLRESAQPRPERNGQHRYLTLKEALEQKKVVVHETGNVNELAVENVSDEDVFIQAGEIVKGGRQDRTLGSDMIITKSMGKTPIASFCVEHGRWTQRGREAAGRFESSDAILASAELKLSANANYAKSDQSKVWASVSRSQAKLSRNAGQSVAAASSPSSLQLTLESPVLADRTAEYERALASLPQEKSDVVGWAYAINGKLVGGDLYDSPELFQKLWPKLLNSACVEAFGELKRAARAPQGGGQNPGKNSPATQPAISAEEVQKFIAAAADAKKSDRDVNARTRVTTWDSPRNVLLETTDRDGDSSVHRAYLVKTEDAQ